MPEQKDTIAAILGASAALAGLLLVFVGFVYARGESYETKRGDKFKLIAKFGVVPFLVALACTLSSAEWMLGHRDLFVCSIRLFQCSVVLTAAYGSAVLLFFL